MAASEAGSKVWDWVMGSQEVALDRGVPNSVVCSRVFVVDWMTTSIESFITFSTKLYLLQSLARKLSIG